MTLPVVLVILRLVGAGILLTFAGAILWYLYQDLRVLRRGEARVSRRLGSLILMGEIDSPDSVATAFDLSPVTTIGRSPANTVVLDEPFVSADHARLTWRGRRWWLEDSGSRNGTLLNDVLVGEPTVIAAGDVITIGNSRLRFESEEE